MMRKFFVALIALLFSCQRMISCDCQTAQVDMKTIASSELIFLGKVVAISGCNGTAKANFLVQELYRGKCFAETSIEFDCSSDCQMDFAPGQTWLIYADYIKYGEPQVKFCSFSRQQFDNEKDDFNSLSHGMTFEAEKNWLKKNLGLQQLNVKDEATEQHHENIRPQGSDILLYLGLGLVGVIGFYFLGRKFLK
jgi:hypothetical protein